MSWIDDNKGQGPWEFSERSDKPHYNEGNLISDHNNPVWATDHLSFSDEPITPTHHPWCGYWYKDYAECSCEGITINYTTLQMSCDEVQTLSVNNPVEGCTYSWEMTSDEGNLSSSTGASVDYTAPSLNANCIYNPTIELSYNGDVCDSITIAVNCYNDWAYGKWGSCIFISPYGWCTKKYRFMCDNTTDGLVYGSHCYNTEEQCIAGGLPGTIIDERSDEAKEGGCCPEGLL